MKWAKDPRERRVFWLNGLAGTGKSTIAQTFSETVAQDGTLGASFFCSRDYLGRKELKNVFPTLAYQLACRHPAFRDRTIQVIKEDPSVARSSLVSQLKHLIVEPLASTGISCVIVVDALDECIDAQPASAILSVLGRHVEDLRSVKFFITGRPEPRIRAGFRLPLLRPMTEVFRLHDVERSTVDEDIRLYLQEKLRAVAKRRSDLDLPDLWPCDEDLTALTKKSSGLFIFASTLVKFVESEHHEPKGRLRLIVTFPESTAHEGRAGVDSLYAQVLTHAFSDVEDPTLFANLRMVLGAVIVAFDPLSRKQISKILGLDESFIATTLRHLHSVLLIPNEGSNPIRVFHKSFPDFLQDPGRCLESKFFVDPTVHHEDMAISCLKLLERLNPNPCDLPDFVMNRDVANLPDLLENKVGSALQYACRYWALHVLSSPTRGSYVHRLIASATGFFKNNAIPWIELMSLENSLESVIHNIHNFLDWISMVNVPTSDIRRLIQDTLRFAMHFFHPIQRSAPHIYHSALPLSPVLSISPPATPRQKTAVTEFYGRPDGWGIVVRTIKNSPGGFRCMTIVGDKIVAAYDDCTVAIYDSITGALRLSLSLMEPAQAIRGSADGSVLFCAHRRPSITSWDIQTGGLAHTFIPEQAVEDFAISVTGRYLACGSHDGSIKIWEIGGGRGSFTIRRDSPVTHLCWLKSEKHLAIATTESAEVWDIASGEKLYASLMGSPVCGLVYSPKLDRLIVITSNTRSTITIISIYPEKVEHYSHEVFWRISCFALSPATGKLVCGTDTGELVISDVHRESSESARYRVTATSVSVLPSGAVVASVVGSGIQLLDLDRGYTPPKQSPVTALTVDAFDEGRIIAVLPTYLDPYTFILLELATMLQLVTIPTQDAYDIPTDHTPILCASLEHRMAVSFLGWGDKWCLQLWKFRSNPLEWTVGVDKLPSIGGISPTGGRLVTFHVADCRTHINVWNVKDGERQADILIGEPSPMRPLGIKFESEDQFFSLHETYRIPYSISPSKPGTTDHTIVHQKQLPLVEKSQRHYDLDDAREWVVASSKRICWIPPGYIRSGHRSFCWIGNLLLMAGEDGELRKLGFQKPSEGQDACVNV